MLRSLGLALKLVNAGARRVQDGLRLDASGPVLGAQRALDWLKMACAFAACIALATTAASASAGAGTVIGGLLALYVLYRRRLRRW